MRSLSFARSAKNTHAKKKNETFFYSSFVLLLLFVVSFLSLGFVSAKDDADYFVTSSISKARSSQRVSNEGESFVSSEKRRRSLLADEEQPITESTAEAISEDVQDAADAVDEATETVADAADSIEEANEAIAEVAEQTEEAV